MKLLIILFLSTEVYSRLFDFEVCKHGNKNIQKKYSEKEISFFCDKKEIKIKNFPEEEFETILRKTVETSDLSLPSIFYISQIMSEINKEKYTVLYTEMIKKITWDNKRGSIELYKTLNKINKVLLMFLKNDYKNLENIMEAMESVYTSLIYFDDKNIITYMLRTYFEAQKILKEEKYIEKINLFFLQVSDIITSNNMQTTLFFKKELYKEYIKKTDKNYSSLFVGKFVFTTKEEEFLCEKKYIAGLLKINFCFQNGNKDPYNFYDILENTYSSMIDKLYPLFQYPNLEDYSLEMHAMESHEEYIRNGLIKNYPTNNGGVTTIVFDPINKKTKINVYVYLFGKEYHALAHEFVHLVQTIFLKKNFNNKILTEGLAEYFGKNYNIYKYIENIFSFPDITVDSIIKEEIFPYHFGFLFFNYVFDTDGISVFQKTYSSNFYKEYIKTNLEKILNYSKIVYEKIKSNTMPVSNTLNTPSTILVLGNENFIFHYSHFYYNNNNVNIKNLIFNCITRNNLHCQEIDKNRSVTYFSKIIKKITSDLYLGIIDFKIYNFEGKLKTEKESDFFLNILFDHGIKFGYNSEKKLFTEIKENIKDSKRIKNSIPLWELSNEIREILYIINIGKDFPKKVRISFHKNKILDIKNRTLSEIIADRNIEKYKSIIFLEKTYNKKSAKKIVVEKTDNKKFIEKIVVEKTDKYLIEVFKKLIEVMSK